MPNSLSYSEQAAAGYDRTFGCHVSARHVPALIGAAGLGHGMHVLDVATGTGLVAQAAIAAVGPNGSVTATDISPAMLAKAQERLREHANVRLQLEDGQSLSFAFDSFDAVLCGLGLMFFPDPTKGLSEFHRVLRPTGHLAVSVGTALAYDAAMTRALARHAQHLTTAAERMFSLEDADRLHALLEQAGFRQVQVITHRQNIVRASFQEYMEPYEQGGGTLGQAFASLPREVREAVREDVRRELGHTDGPLEVASEIRIATGRK